MESHNIYTIDDKYIDIAHQIAINLNSKQQQIESGKKGIVTELGKLISYLDSKIQQDINIKEKKRKPIKFFTYLELLTEDSLIFGHSKQTPVYYEAIYEACNRYIKKYQNEPRTIMQILGWCRRLMYYYETLDEDEIKNLQPRFSTSKTSNNNTSKTPTKQSQTPKPSQKSQTNQPVAPNYKKPKQIDKPQKPVKSVENPKLKKPKQSQPPKPWERPPKK